MQLIWLRLVLMAICKTNDEKLFNFPMLTENMVFS